MAKKAGEVSLKEAVEKFLKDFNLEDKLNETKLVNAWEDVAGKLVHRHTREIYINDRILFIRTDTPALKQELSYQKTRLIEQLNKSVGKQIITDIRFL